jgi:hypothetical protein
VIWRSLFLIVCVSCRSLDGFGDDPGLETQDITVTKGSDTPMYNLRADAGLEAGLDGGR